MNATNNWASLCPQVNSPKELLDFMSLSEQERCQNDKSLLYCSDECSVIKSYSLSHCNNLFMSAKYPGIAWLFDEQLEGFTITILRGKVSLNGHGFTVVLPRYAALECMDYLNE